MCAWQDTVRRLIDLTVPQEMAEAFPKFAKATQRNVTVRYAQAMCTGVLLVALVVVPIGCKEQPKNRFSFPENPTPLPDPSQQIDVGAVHRESGQSLERSK